VSAAASAGAPHAIWGRGPTDVYAVGDTGPVLSMAIGGTTWSTQASG